MSGKHAMAFELLLVALAAAAAAAASSGPRPLTCPPSIIGSVLSCSDAGTVIAGGYLKDGHEAVAA